MKMSKQFRILSLRPWRVGYLCLALLLVGCQSVPKQAEVSSTPWRLAGDEFTERAQEVSTLEQWHYSAKALIKAASGSDQFNLDWRYSNGAHSIHLFGPLGAGAVRLDYSASEARLSDNKGELYVGPDAATLLTEITGLTLPIDALEYWLFAIPSPHGVARYQLSSASTQEVYRIQQFGWETTFTDYQVWGTDTNLAPIDHSQPAAPAAVAEQDAAELVRLPRRITATGRGPDGSMVEVRIVAKLWQF